ncbi:transposase [Arenibacter sp. M-2]|uniref:transposase n=1 Tax=Arenibacter sp. M-2 TaxID=3053612 RepID=UPI003364E31F
MDSTLIKVCHTKREKQNRVFKGIAEKGKGSMGWFFGFKLHIIINERGQIIDFLITQGNVDDRQLLKDKTFHNKDTGRYSPIGATSERICSRSSSWTGYIW